MVKLELFDSGGLDVARDAARNYRAPRNSR